MVGVLHSLGKRENGGARRKKKEKGEQAKQKTVQRQRERERGYDGQNKIKVVFVPVSAHMLYVCLYLCGGGCLCKNVFAQVGMKTNSGP